jgi:hypothetical protein
MDSRVKSPDWVALRNEYQRVPREGQLDRFVQRRWGQADTLRDWLEQESLTGLTLRQAQSLYRAAGGRQTREFNTNSEADLRDSLDFLLYDTITLEARFAECVSEQGAFKLVGAGREFISFVLCLSNPRLFAVWNPASQRALRRLGMHTPTMSRGHVGLAYLEVLDALELVRRRVGLEDYRQVDEFCYLMGR